MAFTSSMMQQSLDTSCARRVRPRAAPASAAGLVAGRCDETRCCAAASEVNTTTSQHGSCFLPHEEEKEKSRRGRGRGSSALCASTQDESGAISISSYISAHGFTFWLVFHSSNFLVCQAFVSESASPSPPINSIKQYENH